VVTPAGSLAEVVTLSSLPKSCVAPGRISGRLTSPVSVAAFVPRFGGFPNGGPLWCPSPPPSPGLRGFDSACLGGFDGEPPRVSVAIPGPRLEGFPNGGPPRMPVAPPSPGSQDLGSQTAR